jgi:uncharacterized Fe-S center protein
LPKLKWWIDDKYLSLLPSDKARLFAYTLVIDSERNFLEINKIEKIEKLCEIIGLGALVNSRDMVAVKLHFGEGEAKGVVLPAYISTIVRYIRQKKGNVFLTDTATVYCGERSNAIQHMRAAIKNGYRYETVDAPIIIADGLKGMDFEEVETEGEIYKKIKVASAIYYSDMVISIAHFKGHEITGIGGAIKNLGMGCAPRPGKLEMHSTIAPVVREDRCSGCGTCIKHCASEAMSLKDGGKRKIAQINDKCTGCGYCLAICPSDAIGLQWNESSNVLQKKMSEHAYGAIKGKKTASFNFLTHITAKCDCYSDSGDIILNDIGVLASLDPVALDTASLDLCNKIAKKDKFKEVYPDIDARIQLEHAQKIGMGSMKYDLVTIV